VPVAFSELLGGATMRALLAVVIFAGGILVPHSAADAGRKYKRSAKTPCYAVQPRHFRNSACARGAWWGYSPYDPAGEFRGFPGWARKAFNNLRN
jgi:hypothetical protein